MSGTESKGWSRLKARAAGFLEALGSGWTWRMAWRDTRRSRRKLLLFGMSIVLGVGALSGIGSFKAQMERGVEDQAKTLLGADLSVTARDPFTEEMEEWMSGLGGTQAREINFSSMAFFPKTESTRLVQVRALEGDFPFYGALETEPAQAAREFRVGRNAVVEAALMAQFNAELGDTIKIGEKTFTIVGRLKKVPGETVVFSTLAPRAYIPLQEVEGSGLLSEGSLARYTVYFRFDPDTDMTELIDENRRYFDQFRLDADTVRERKREFGRALTNLDRFLSLVGFVALLLGGVGIGSAIHVHIRERLNTIAVLRCLGSRVPQAFAVYLVQALGLGFAAATLGAALGLAVQWLLPYFVADLLPLKTAFSISWTAVGRGVAIGVLLCLGFALIPLMPVRLIPPLAAFRADYEPPSRRGDPAVWFCYGALALGIVAFSVWQTQSWRIGLSFAGGLGAAMGLLALLAVGIMRLLRRSIPSRLPYVGRQALANLYRPGNRTALLILSIGLGTCLILTLHLVQTNLVRGLFPAEQASQGNAVFFDIQPDQREGVEAMLRQQGLPILQEAPIVSMRLHSINGRTVDEILQDPDRRIARWVLRREYRSTYRSELTSTERLVAGTWHERVENADAPVPVSLEEGIAERLRVGIGDEIVFDVQGVPVATRVASLREVEWRRLHPNFFVVFPLGVLEEAPAFHILLTRIPSSAQSGMVQREIVKAFPNVSTVDLGLILETVDTVLGKISFVIRFMAAFTVATGLLILVGAVLSSRYQRIRESILLRTLGASRSQIFRLLVIEYLVLGLAAGLSGGLLALAGSWALAKHLFELEFSPQLGVVGASLVIVSLLTAVVGTLSSRGVCNQPPLEVLRGE